MRPAYFRPLAGWVYRQESQRRLALERSSKVGKAFAGPVELTHIGATGKESAHFATIRYLLDGRADSRYPEKQWRRFT